MLGMHGSIDIDLGESLLEIDGPLDIPQDMLYNRGAVNLSGNFLSEEQQIRSETVHAQIMSELNVVCDTESQTSKHKRSLENTDSARSRQSSRAREETSFRLDDNVGIDACGESSATLKSLAQKLRPKHLCEECGKTFKRAHNLKIHGRLHSGDRPYVCPFENCEKEFRWKSSIVSHLNWHRTKKGDVLPGNFADMHELILKKKKKKTSVVKKKTPQATQEPAPVQEQGNAEYHAFENDPTEQHDFIGQSHVAGEISEIVGMEQMTSFATGLSDVGLHYDGDIVEKEEKDDATVLTPSTTSYQAPPAALEMNELDCLPVLDVKEWETRSEGCRSGISSVLLPSLSCCRLENEGDGFGSFLEEN